MFLRRHHRLSLVLVGSLHQARSSLSLTRTILMMSSTTKSSTSSTSTGTSNIAVAQLRSTSNKWDNLVNVARCAGWAQQQQCSMLFLPECFGFIGSSAAETLEAAEDIQSTRTNAPAMTDFLTQTMAAPDTTTATEISIPNNNDVSLLDGVRHIAKISGLWISAGGIHLKSHQAAEKVSNTHLIFDRTGAISATYHKMHLFDVCIPEQNVDLRESKTTVPGTEVVVCRDTPIGTLGVTVCYDLRFPELYTRLVHEMGAQVLLIPSAFTVPTGRAHWHTLLRARAIENQCYVIAAAQCGQHNTKRASYGHSLVVDPWGTVIGDAGGEDTAPQIITCSIDSALVESTRAKMPIQEHRKKQADAAARKL